MNLSAPIFFAVITTLLLSVILTKGCLLFSKKYGLFIDEPNERSSHSGSVPRCGGISIAVITLFAVVFFVGFKDIRITGYLIGAVLVTVLGIIDDLSQLSSKTKLAATIVIALVPLMFGISFLNHDILFGIPAAQYLLSFVWIFGMMNAFNFMDGIDGLIGGSSIVYSFFLMCLAYLYGNNAVLLMSSVLMITCCGFTFFNFSPASIFLGDVGSMFLGFSFAVFSIMIVRENNVAELFWAPAAIFAPVIYDSMFTFFNRVFRKEKFTTPHKEHLYQQLVILGFSHRVVSSFYYMLAMLAGTSALLFMYYSDARRWLLALLVFLVLAGFTIRVYGLQEENRKNV